MKNFFKDSAKVSIALLPVGLGGGFFAFRYYVRSEVRKALMAEYRASPILIGNAFYSAVHGALPLRVVSEAEVKELVEKLTVEFVPLLSLSIPDKKVIKDAITERAIPSALDAFVDLL